MRCRPAEQRDIPALVEMGSRFHSASGYRDIPYDREAMGALMARLVDAGGLFVAGEKPVGMIGGVLFPAYFNPSVLMAQELFWWSEQKGAGMPLLAAFERWAKDMGAERVVMMSLEELDAGRVGRILKGRGYTAAEHNYMRVI